ncbi:putative Diguanylate cyclase [Desulfamplus magnetovallimortis]|uniref:diguanylate cyclase n=1 Tax=Desulfamplus magnetovallimortis TaxID=1246637 RepID=A0A1W1H7P1_9BACT|nr:GGDEF domain-containing protein [Desulfamplus magnetovallimortis]SLM28388.1 putative Diguanylate cyclase [Desulfamplus magnetovallimortis]
MNRDLSEALALRYDNNQLVKNLHIEKKNTERLNEQLMSKNRELKSLTRIDPLTGLKNRRYLFEVFTPENTRLMKDYLLDEKGTNRRFKQHASQNPLEPILTNNEDDMFDFHDKTNSINYGYGIFMMDIDKFKRVNDTYGHDSGDMILRQFSTKLTDQVRSDDAVVRMGGEEFVVILKLAEERYIDRFAEKIRTSIEEYMFSITQGRKINITTSVGYVFYPFFSKFPMSMTFEQMISLSDKALYHAKENGRNMCVRVRCRERDSDNIETVKSVCSNLDRAVEKGNIFFEICPPCSSGAILKKKKKSKGKLLNDKNCNEA